MKTSDGGKILLSTAYLPPVEYISLISKADEILIEKEENYLKQSYRNRCYILSSHGPQLLSVPVFEGSIHKVKIKDIRIDYSKRWQQVHSGAIRSSYGSSPYYPYYIEDIENLINRNFTFLIDLNMSLLNLVLNIIKLKKSIRSADEFTPLNSVSGDYRYSISPKKISDFEPMSYSQVFSEAGFVPGLSIIDLIFNKGPESIQYL